MSTNKTVNTVVSQSASAQEKAHLIARAIENNRTQRAAEYETDDIVTVWSIRIKGAIAGKAHRFEAVLSRASLFAPTIAGNKGHAMRGAFKAVKFQFDAKTGERFFAPSETRERKNAVHAVAWLIEEFQKGQHAISNGNHNVKGYNQLLKPRFIQFSQRYAGMSVDTEYIADTVNSDLKQVERD